MNLLEIAYTILEDWYKMGRIWIWHPAKVDWSEHT